MIISFARKLIVGLGNAEESSGNNNQKIYLTILHLFIQEINTCILIVPPRVTVRNIPVISH